MEGATCCTLPTKWALWVNFTDLHASTVSRMFFNDEPGPIELHAVAREMDKPWWNLTCAASSSKSDPGMTSVISPNCHMEEKGFVSFRVFGALTSSVVAAAGRFNTRGIARTDRLTCAYTPWV